MAASARAGGGASLSYRRQPLGRAKSEESITYGYSATIEAEDPRWYQRAKNTWRGVSIGESLEGDRAWGTVVWVHAEYISDDVLLFSISYETERTIHEQIEKSIGIGSPWYVTGTWVGGR
jgi:hypothetical protein